MEWKWARLGLALSLVTSCALDRNGSFVIRPTDIAPGSGYANIPDDEVGVDIVIPTQEFLQSEESAEFVPTPDNSAVENGAAQALATEVPATATEQPLVAEQPTLENPYKGEVFNQRCKVLTDADGNIDFSCVQGWAEETLPGGCWDNRFRNYKGSSSCNATSTSYVLNQLVPPEVFMKVIGQPGITPDVLIDDVYTSLPDGKAIKMSCRGAGPVAIKAALSFFGLEYRDVLLSEYTVADVVENLQDGEVLMVALIGKNSKGRTFQHWSVAADVIEVNGVKRVRYHDSYFYVDPEHPNYDTVMFEDSPNILNDPNRYTGKSFDYVGAIIVKAPAHFDLDEFVQNPVSFVTPTAAPTEYVMSEKGLETVIIDFGNQQPKVLGEPVRMGDGRYKVPMEYDGKQFDYYYYNPEGQEPVYDKELYFRWKQWWIPLYRQQDPRWSGEQLDGSGKHAIPLFGVKGCGQTITASLLSMSENMDEGETPIEVQRTFFPEVVDGGTLPINHVRILSEAGFTVTTIAAQWHAIESAVKQGKLVVIQAGVNFKWWADNPVVSHYVLVLGQDENGNLIFHDPYWGTFVTEQGDVDLSQSTGAFTVDR